MEHGEGGIFSLQEELESLRRENHELSLANKRLARSLDLAQKLVERNKVAAQAKDNLASMVSAKRTELEKYMNLLLGNCPDMILLFDREGQLAYCTDSFLRLGSIPGFGIIKGTTCIELLSPYAEQVFLNEMNRVLALIYGEKKTFEFSGTVDFSRTGKPRTYSIQVTPMIADSGNAEGFMIILSDTTEFLRAQREAERANAAKSDFLATVSHEIRTPMNAIIGVAGMLKSTGLDERQYGYLKSIQDSSHVLLNLINDILDLSKIEADKLELVEGYFRLKDLLRHLESMFELMFQQKGIYFVCEYSGDLPEVVYGDDKRIRQILTNILNNALKYTKHGRVEFRVCKEPGGMLRFEVEDTGIGIRKDALPKIFSAFEQLDLARNKGVIGTGLGLAITRRLCGLMNGSIEVESEYDKGSCFTVRLPLGEGSPADLSPEERSEVFTFKVTGARALIVDDIEINLQIASYILDMFGVVSDSVQSGRQAIEMAASNTYDIIFMDHMMPEMDGIEATKIIRSMGKPAGDVPVVALTANAVSDAVEKFFAAGFADFLSKPIDDAAMARCLLKWLPKEKILES